MVSARPREVVLGSASVQVPIFFPSVSSVKTALQPAEYLALLHSLREVNRQFLVSAFDLARLENKDELVRWLGDKHQPITTVLMDSGNYESYWKEFGESWRQPNYHDVLKHFPCTFAFGFDEQSPPDDKEAHTCLIVERWQKDQLAAGGRVIVPIVHGNINTLPIICSAVAQATRVPMVAVPERCLGNGVFERARSVDALRRALNDTGRYIGLHLLGTGNPISIAIYSWAGADSFDGLEWCQTVVDHDSGLLFHLSHSDFFLQQTEWGNTDISFYPRTLAHNLYFYADWMHRLCYATHYGDILTFFKFNFPQRVFQKCAAAFGWVVNP